MKTQFDKAIWLGPKPSNKAREALLSHLIQFLAIHKPLETSYVPDAAKQLIMGNAEDWDIEKWPKADSVKIFVGVFFNVPPSSNEMLEAFDKNEISFYINENSSTHDLADALADL